jgi:hypothetical protein
MKQGSRGVIYLEQGKNNTERRKVHDQSSNRALAQLSFEALAVLKRYLSIFNEVIFDSKVDR